MAIFLCRIATLLGNYNRVLFCASTPRLNKHIHKQRSWVHILLSLSLASPYCAFFLKHWALTHSICLHYQIKKTTILRAVQHQFTPGATLLSGNTVSASNRRYTDQGWEQCSSMCPYIAMVKLSVALPYL
jgi:hypothetical protein